MKYLIVLIASVFISTHSKAFQDSEQPKIESFDMMIQEQYTQVDFIRQGAADLYAALLDFEIKEECFNETDCAVKAIQIVCQDGLSHQGETDISSCYESDNFAFRWRPKEKSKTLIKLIRLVDDQIQKKLNKEKRKDGQKMRYTLKQIDGEKKYGLYYKMSFLISREIIK